MRSNRFRPRPDGCDPLEGRALLSPSALTAPLPLPALSPTQLGPVVDRIGRGFVVKSPRLYPYYTGTTWAYLNAAGAKAVAGAQGTLTLTGILAGAPVTKPSDAAGSSYYVWGIDRGALGPGTLPGRPGVRFDAEVVVAITPAGVSATVADLKTGRSTAVDPSAVNFKPDAVQVSVPLSLLPPDPGASLASYRVTFLAMDAPPSAGFRSVASLAPEFRGFPVAFGRVQSGR